MYRNSEKCETQSKQWPKQEASLPLDKETTCEGWTRHRRLGSPVNWWGSNRFVYARGLRRFSRVQLFVSPRTAAHQASLCMGFSRQEYWSGMPCPLPGDLPDPGIKPASLALQVSSLPLRHQQSPTGLFIPPSQPWIPSWDKMPPLTLRVEGAHSTWEMYFLLSGDQER